ncbi:hypothetical protein [Paenisporosarcina sp. OV554]|uniref:hypothetical protein n=1 Tax=Paenisporosarcina sp. OV554 TaxID=2135694 RepID=UPI000D3A8C14|nr:hypothetical protein [Paenisporosarcina sp. OV554]PUB10076.1 hypothetical protein C8K15_1213 [Paenisporosarcina sp. OV554]
MVSMSATIFTRKNIADSEVAEAILNIMSVAGFTPEKIGLFEPLKTTFTKQEFIRMWLDESPGCYDEEVGMTGTAGGMIAKIKKPNFSLYVSWWDCPDKKSFNTLDFYFTKQTFKSHRSDIEKLFKDSLAVTNGFYGYISESNVEDRQHVTGTLKTRLPGIFWCNYFGESFLNFFGKEKIQKYPWWKVEKGHNNGQYLYLTESPLDELLRDASYERKAKKYLGETSFGDEDQYRKKPDIIQVKSVPPM